MRSFSKKLKTGWRLSGLPLIVLYCLGMAGPTFFPDHTYAAEEDAEDEAAARRKKKKNADDEIPVQAILITASRNEKELFDLPMSVSVVTDEDIKRNPATSIADLLSGLPGIMLDSSQSSAGGKMVSIRGEDAGRTLFLIDGVKNVDIRDSSTSYSSLMVDPSQVERIEIIKGPATVLYGAEGIGGVVNIITKKGGDKPVGFSQNFIADSSTASLEVQSALFGTYKGFNYRFSGSGVNADDRKTPSGKIPNSSYSNRYYSGNIGYDWGAGSFYVNASRYESYINFSIATPGGEGTGMQFMQLPRNDREVLGGSLEFRELTSFLPKLTFNLARQNTDRDWRVRFDNPSFLPGMIPTSVDTLTQSEQEGISGSVKSEWSLGSHYIVAGLDHDDDDLDVHTTVNRFKVPKVDTLDSKANNTTTGLYVQDQWAFHEGWEATLGFRQTWIKTSFDGNIVDNWNPVANPSKNKTDYSKTVANLGLVYTGIDNWALRAQWSQGFKYPTLSQLYLATVGPALSSSTTLRPNPDLKPETSNNYEIGARFNNGDWNFDLALFYTKSKEFIHTRDMPDGTRQYQNAARAETYGSEISLEYTFHDLGLTPYASGTWLHRVYDYGNGFKTRLTRTPALQGRAGLKWQGEVNSGQRVFANIYTDMATEAKSKSAAGGSTTTYSSWQTLNLVLGLEGGEDHKYNASLSLKNIGNREYYTARGNAALPEPGFHVILGLGFQY